MNIISRLEWAALCMFVYTRECVYMVPDAIASGSNGYMILDIRPYMGACCLS